MEKSERMLYNRSKVKEWGDLMFLKKGEEPLLRGKSDIAKDIMSLDYFETINFLAMINKANNPNWSSRDCYSEATAMYSDNEKVIFTISETFKVGLH